jgi:4-diphosphocytidyl-2-C-methyl-D-erythritol kinase
MSILMYQETKDMAASKQFTKAGNGLLVQAPAKINLSLLVKGKRPDGYHELETIMAKINWYDEILIEQKTENRKQKTGNEGPCAEGRGRPLLRRSEYEEQRTEGRGQVNIECRSETDIELICKGPYEVPEGEDNLVYKAAKLILDCGLQISDFNNAGKMPATLRITLTKNIPAGTGLGSGSSDAAGTLMGINRFLKLGLSKKQLAVLASQLGSDVAFFLDGPTSFCTGRGEKVQKLPKSEFGVFLIVPDVSVSTKRVYENYQHDAAVYKRFHRAISGYIKKKRIDLVSELCTNMLQESCFELNTKLRELKKEIEQTGIGPVCLSGSGSSMYCIINKGNEEKIVTCQNKLARKLGCKSIILNNNSW